MNFSEYLAYFQSVLQDSNPKVPYNQPDYQNYTKLNWSRMNRWLKTARLNDTISEAVRNIKNHQDWIVITEPWCGDAAHIVPFLELIAQQNPNIRTDYQLRDAEPFLINQYLTNGKSKSIPKLVIRNEMGSDLAVWGPRPLACQKVYDQLHQQHTDFETLKIALQEWYNKDQGHEIMQELAALIG